MGTVLVCVRSPAAARAIAACAERLGLGTVVRTATSGVEIMARLAERPADVIFVDGAAVHTDPVGCVRRALAFAPDAALVLFGADNHNVAAGVVAAGARGVIKDGDEDLITAVTKTLFLLGRPGRGSPGGGLAPGRALRVPLVSAGSEPVPALAPGTPVGGEPGRAEPGGAQRAEPTVADPGHVLGVNGAAHGGDGPLAAEATGGHQLVPAQRGDAAEQATGRRLALTEREIQVLRGMADGRSNAEIGRELFVSEDTVKTHARRLFRKLGARDRAHAVAAGFRAGLMS